MAGTRLNTRYMPPRPPRRGRLASRGILVGELIERPLTTLCEWESGRRSSAAPDKEVAITLDRYSHALPTLHTKAMARLDAMLGRGGDAAPRTSGDKGQ